MKVNISLTIHFFDSHSDFFPKNLRVVSDKHGKICHQDISQIERKRISWKLEAFVCKIVFLIFYRFFRNYLKKRWSYASRKVLIIFSIKKLIEIMRHLI